MKQPLCVKCQVYLKCEKNEVRVLQTWSEEKKPDVVYYADLFKCPKCGYEIITGFGWEPILYWFDPDFNKKLTGEDGPVFLVHLKQ